MNILRKARATLGAGAISLIALTSAAQAQEDVTIALIPGLTADAFYITMRKGAEAAAEAVGAELIYQGAAEWNVGLQVPVLDAIIARQPDAILIAPNDKDQLIEPMRRAEEAGIAVITVDTFIGDGIYQTGAGDADFPMSYVASDNLLGGQMAARALAAAINETGSVYVASLKPGVSTLDQREEGFRMEIANYPNITVLETQYNDQDPNKAAAQFQAVLGRQPDLAGVFGANLFSAVGAANGAEQAGVAGEVKIAGFDAPESIVDQLKDGTLEMTIAQHPAEIGYFGVMAAYAVVTGNPTPTAIGTGFTVMTGDNIDDPEVNRYLYSE